MVYVQSLDTKGQNSIMAYNIRMEAIKKAKLLGTPVAAARPGAHIQNEHAVVALDKVTVTRSLPNMTPFCAVHIGANFQDRKWNNRPLSSPLSA